MIKRGVMSFWTAPCRHRLWNAWASDDDHKRAWEIASGLLRRHFSEVALVTDSAGWDYLRPLQLPFTEVSTALDDLDPALSAVWSLGKIKAYSMQERPFVHVDSDAYLFKPLGERLLTAPVVAQMPEKFSRSRCPGSYKLDEMCAKVKIPSLVRRAASRPIQYAVNSGLFGGNDLDTIRAHADLAFACLETDRAGWQSLGGFETLILLEQWLIGAVVRERGTFMEYLFPCFGGPRGSGSEQTQEDVGFVHLWSGDKRDREKLRRVDEWFKREQKAA